MKKTNIYVDTSVIGSCCDPEFQEYSFGLLKNFQAGHFSLLLSEITDTEIQDAPDEVKNVYPEFREYADRIVELTSEAVELADAYLNHGILAQNFRFLEGKQCNSPLFKRSRGHVRRGVFG